MGKRRRARELALQYLYQWDFHGPAGEEAVSIFWDTRTESAKVKSFADEIVAGVKQNQAEIDRLIEQNSRNWKLRRMSRIDRNILRIAVWELAFSDDIPPKVAMDEAIEIGKRFGTSESGAFINGILDQIGKKTREARGRMARAKESANESPGDGDTG